MCITFRLDVIFWSLYETKYIYHWQCFNLVVIVVKCLNSFFENVFVTINLSLAYIIKMNTSICHVVLLVVMVLIVQYFVWFSAFRKTLTLGAQTYELKLVDTAGQDEYTIFPTHYTLDAHGYILVYSINSKKSFEILKLIYQKLLNLSGKPYVITILFN